MSALIGLQCHLCKALCPTTAVYVCDKCLGPLEPLYDYDSIKLTRDEIAARPKNLWRYRELLPITGEPLTGFHSGFTPLVRCDRLAARLGLGELYVKDDSVNHPTLSYKDRVVSVAATRAKELGFDVLACASTGNLANSVSAHAARLGMECSVFIPDNLEAGKLLGSAIFGPTILAIAGNYDDVNRLCTQVADRYGWGFVNINLRAYYAEGAKTLGFEVVEQLGWRYPRHLVSPVAGGTLLPRIARGFRELARIGLVAGELPRIHAAQAAGCAPVVRALEAGLDHPEPVKPDTIAKSIAIGNPADGYQVIQTVRATGGSGSAVGDTQIVEAIRLLAETEGIFTEPAGGTTLAATIDLVRRGVIRKDESVVVCVTGNGYKTAEVVTDRLAEPVRLGRAFKEFEAWWESRRALA
ncbi:MAG: threonine synthase [Acidobacteria bacterium]|nr:MAG: threonine synthase [Acidobacteriota bacterium]TMB85725.1 MAG: threonine synthase [Chloroflexota bacterium]